MGWKDDARRTVISEKYNLETFEGFWIKAKKYSINARDEINAAVREVQKGLDKRAILEVTKKAREMGLSGSTPTEAEIMDMLTPEQLSALIDSSNVASSKVMETKLRNGIAEHSFGDTKVADLARDILEFPDIANEMLTFIEEFNRPLTKQTSPASAMSPSGSTEAAPLNTETPSLMDENPQSF